MPHLELLPRSLWRWEKNEPLTGKKGQTDIKRCRQKEGKEKKIQKLKVMVLFDLYAPWIRRSCCAMISMHVINQCILMLLHAGVWLHHVMEIVFLASCKGGANGCTSELSVWSDTTNMDVTIMVIQGALSFSPQLLCHSYVMETKKTCMWLTFDYLLGTGAVDLLLCAVSWEDSVKHIRLPLWRRTQTQSAMTKTV